MASMEDDPGVKLVRTCGACPEQYEGTVDGNPAYFRLRHLWWRFCIVKPGEDPISPQSGENVLYCKDGETAGPGDGIMDDAPGLIMSMVQEFRNPSERTKP
jgi:hypothetical protein